MPAPDINPGDWVAVVVDQWGAGSDVVTAIRQARGGAGSSMVTAAGGNFKRRKHEWTDTRGTGRRIRPATLEDLAALHLRAGRDGLRTAVGHRLDEWTPAQVAAVHAAAVAAGVIVVPPQPWDL